MKKIMIEIDKLKFDIRTAVSNKQVPMFLFLHGFKSFRNWGFIPFVTEQIALKDFISVNIDFTKNGVVNENPIKFDIDIFSQNTVAQEIKDIDCFFSILHNPANWNSELKIGLVNWNGKIILCGHSRGAGIAIVTAAKYIEVEKLILLAPVSTFNRYTPRFIEKWIKNGYFEFNDPSSEQKLKISSSYIVDLLDNSDRYNLKKIMEKLDIPTLIVHGDNDLSTPLREGRELLENYKKNIQNKNNHCNFVIINKANHLFNCNHPFSGSNIYLDEVMHNIVDFLVYE